MSKWILGLLVVVGCLTAVQPASAVVANPLQNAYWRFEEGTAGAQVPVNDNAVLDSINANHMRTFADFTAPFYTATVPGAVVPQTGAPNLLAMDFSPNQDIYSWDNAAGDGQMINNPITSAFTVEATFMANIVGGPFQGIIGKDGKPSPAIGVQTFVLKVRGDNNLLQVEQYDAAGGISQVSSLATIQPGRWYHAAAVNDGSTLSLWLDSNDGNGYQLQGTAAVSGALFEIDSTWTIGRGMWDNNPADWFDGIIDEVRISNTALDPSEFLWVPEPATLALIGLGAGVLFRRRRR